MFFFWGRGGGGGGGQSDRLSRPELQQAMHLSTASRNQEMPLPCMRVPGY